jgi:GTP cyclohydrolase II/ABC transporter substrate binding protein
MRRREFIAGIGGAAAWPVVARGQQQPRKLAAIGLLGSDTAVAQIQMTDAFLERLRELGWSAERNLAIEYRWAEGHTERLVELANELVRLKVDLIVTHNTPPTLAAKKATSAIPIVFASAGDPVGSGIVASLSRPGGNVTGMSSVETETAGKRVELLHEQVLYLEQEGRGLGLANKILTYQLQDGGLDTVDANTVLGFDDDERDYGIAVRMLQMLGCTRVQLMTNNPSKLDGLSRAGIDVCGRVPLHGPINPENRRYLAAKATRSGHQLDPMLGALAEPVGVGAARPMPVKRVLRVSRR